MKLQYLILLSISCLSSCALFLSNNEPKDITPYQAITGINLKKGATEHELKSILQKNESMSGGEYQVSFLPLTSSYIEAIVNKKSQYRGLSIKEKSILLKEFNSKFIEQKVCILFDYSVIKFKKSSQLKNWKLEFIDHMGDLYPMKWTNEDLTRRAALSEVKRMNGSIEQWLGHGIACSEQKLVMNKGFGIQVTTDFVQYPFNKKKKLFWEFDQEVLNKKGETIIIKKKKRGHQKYRGW